MVSREQLSSDLRTRTRQVLQNPNLFTQFPQSQLQQLDPRFAGATSFLPTGVPNPYAGSFQQQRAPGANYLNYETMAPNVGGPLLKPQPPEGYVPAGTQPEVIRVNPDGTPAADEEEDDSLNSSLEEALERINALRLIEGKEPYESMAEFQADIRSQIGIGSEGGGFNPLGGMAGMGPMYAAEGGIASLSPVAMKQGGLLSQFGQGIGNVLGGIGTGIGEGIGGLIGGIGSGVRGATAGIGSFLEKGMENYRANQAKAEEKKSLLKKDPKTMTREELIELINMLQGKSSSGMGTKPKGDSGFQPKYGKDQLDLVSMSEGGDVDFPRMNGPISGPGTETSDDIPAMLSDGEFVVNAKAVRGIGRLEGAGKSKAEQRREGARMMYALQRAGEQAMRKA